MEIEEEKKETEAGTANDKKKEEIFRGSGGMPLRNFWKSRLKSVHFEAFWRQIWVI